jgi:transcriptional regulator with XRE-family HTH domain
MLVPSLGRVRGKTMSPQQLIDFRTRMGWTQSELARRLDLSPSRISDYEAGRTRSKPPRPALVPKVVELACRWLEEHARPLTPQEKAALWREFLATVPKVGHVIDDSREALYEDDRGR